MNPKTQTLSARCRIVGLVADRFGASFVKVAGVVLQWLQHNSMAYGLGRMDTPPTNLRGSMTTICIHNHYSYNPYSYGDEGKD